MTDPLTALPLDAPQPAAVARQWRRLAGAGTTPWLHDEVARRLADKLEAILLQPRSWLDWSGHLGGTVEAVCARYPLAMRWVHEREPLLAQRFMAQWQTDQAPPWWAAWKRTPQAPLLTPTRPMPEGWPADGVDMIWANMALHSSLDLGEMLRLWLRWLKVDGFVMCSGLGPDTGLELRKLYATMGWGSPSIRFMDMHDLGDALVTAGFHDPVMDMERITLTWPDAPAMLAECHSWGGNVALGRLAGCRTPRWRERLLAAMEANLRRPDGRLGLTVELVYGHAIKPEPRVKMAAESKVSLEDMRRMVKGSG